MVPRLLPHAFKGFIDTFWEILGRQVRAKLEAKKPPWAFLEGMLKAFLSALDARECDVIVCSCEKGHPHLSFFLESLES